MNLNGLAEPFPACDVQWRTADGGVTFDQNGNVKDAKVFAYLSNQAIMQRLDDVCGPDNWSNTFQPWHAFPGEDGKARPSQLCGITIRMEDGRLVTKFDGAECSDYDPCKGGLTSAMKRAAVQWGIGRYLYDLGELKAEVTPRGYRSDYAWNKSQNKKVWFRWNPPAMPDKFLPASERKGAAREARPSEDAVATQPAADAPPRIQPFFDEPWKNVVVHFGKMKGWKLGSVAPERLSWLQGAWLAARKAKGVLPEEEVLYQAVLDSLGAQAHTQPRDEIPF